MGPRKRSASSRQQASASTTSSPATGRTKGRGHVPREVVQPSVMPTATATMTEELDVGGGIVETDGAEVAVNGLGMNGKGTAVSSSSMAPPKAAAGLVPEAEVAADDSNDSNKDDVWQVERGSLTALLVQQLKDNQSAYEYDRDYCADQLKKEDSLSGQEVRNLRIRMLDLGHHIRSTKQKMDILKHFAKYDDHRYQQQQQQQQHRGHLAPAPSPADIVNTINTVNAVSSFSPINGASGRPSINNAAAASPDLSLLHHAAAESPPVVLGKRSRPITEGMTYEDSPSILEAGGSGSGGGGGGGGWPRQIGGGGGGGGGVSTTDRPVVKKGKHATIKLSDFDEDSGNQVQRLGFWKCRLCASAKYLSAPPGRQPSAPCKWPLRDIAKMMVHFSVMHFEHAPTERCRELGDAIDSNRGPFEYWLRHSRSMDLGNGSIIDDIVAQLKTGTMPVILRRLSKAASQFPEEGQDDAQTAG